MGKKQDITGKRWSGFDWATEQSDIMIVGIGSIGSYVALCLARSLHSLFLIDGDEVDETNVQGGQLYRTSDVGKKKVVAVTEICRQFGCTGEIMPVDTMYTPETGMTDICICGLDNMAARKLVFESWETHLKNEASEKGTVNDCLFIDGRITGELFEAFAIKGNDLEAIEEYKRDWLFNDSVVPDLDCTVKSTTFIGMGIAWNIVSLLNNWLTNKKMGMELREVPFHSRFYSPIFQVNVSENVEI